MKLHRNIALGIELDQDKTYLSHQTGFNRFYCAQLIKKM